MRVCRFILVTFVTFLAATGCSQTTYKASTFRRTVTTNVVLHTNVPAEVSVSDRSLGTTPLSFPFTYEEEVDRRVGTANYWETNPGTAAALSVLSLGVYVPFSFISAEETAESRPAGKFVNNELSLRVVAESDRVRGHPL